MEIYVDTHDFDNENICGLGSTSNGKKIMSLNMTKENDSEL
jgi:hypothetical protein